MSRILNREAEGALARARQRGRIHEIKQAVVTLLRMVEYPLSDAEIEIQLLRHTELKFTHGEFTDALAELNNRREVTGVVKKVRAWAFNAPSPPRWPERRDQ